MSDALSEGRVRGRVYKLDFSNANVLTLLAVEKAASSSILLFNSDKKVLNE